jgi:hypothetical protein
VFCLLHSYCEQYCVRHMLRSVFNLFHSFSPGLQQVKSAIIFANRSRLHVGKCDVQFALCSDNVPRDSVPPCWFGESLAQHL